MVGQKLLIAAGAFLMVAACGPSAESDAEPQGTEPELIDRSISTPAEAAEMEAALDALSGRSIKTDPESHPCAVFAADWYWEGGEDKDVSSCPADVQQAYADYSAEIKAYKALVARDGDGWTPAKDDLRERGNTAQINLENALSRHGYSRP